MSGTQKEADPFFIKAEVVTPAEPQTVNGSFSYDGFGDYGVVVIYSKHEGFPPYRLQLQLPRITQSSCTGQGPLFIIWTIDSVDEQVNVHEHPQSHVVMRPEIPNKKTLNGPQLFWKGHN